MNIILLGILTLNLHTWQESHAREKLDRVADYIALENLDFVTLQEVGQHQEGVATDYPFAPFQPEGDELFPDDLEYPEDPGNSALYLVQRLKEVHGLDYSLIWTWAHMGFGVFQEGSAILSRYPLVDGGRAFVSSEENRYDVSTRRILWAEVDHPVHGLMRLVSVHVGWGNQQVPQIQKALDVLSNLKPLPTLMAGDFNMEPSAPGYALIKSLGWVDQALGAKERGRGLATMGNRRIDYVWASAEWTLPPQKSLVQFSQRQKGADAPVSDHAGVVIRY